MFKHTQKYEGNINKWTRKDIQDAVDRVKVVEQRWAIKKAEMTK